MRTLILLSTLIVLSACSDQQTTAPANSRSANGARSSVAGDGRMTSQLVASQGKPVDVVGFTKVTTVVSTWTFIPGQSGFAHTNCPAGTTVIGGGFGYDLDLVFGFPTVPAPPMLASGIVDNGWSIILQNNQPGAIAWTIEVSAYCAS